MMPAKQPERRRSQRVDLTTYCPTSFTYQEREHRALMMNVSEAGARFKSDEHADPLALAIGDILVLKIQTPYGPAECMGMVIWTEHLENYYTWGVEFTQVNKTASDPLQSLLDSSF